jgi:chemotaxis protein MotB
VRAIKAAATCGGSNFNLGNRRFNRSFLFRREFGLKSRPAIAFVIVTHPSANSYLQRLPAPILRPAFGAAVTCHRFSARRRLVRAAVTICGWTQLLAWTGWLAGIKSAWRSMSESRQPLTEHLTKTSRGTNPARLGWIVAGILGALVIALLLLWAAAVGKQRGLESLRSKLAEANASLAGALNDIQKDNDQIAALQAKVADLEQEKETAAQMAKGLEDEMRADLESKDVTISKLQGKLTVNILDRVMFDSGEAILKPDGAAVMRKIAAILAEHPKLKVHVIGHTDNVPIRSRFASNWELSTARALAAVHFLTEKAGIDPRRVGAVGYGEYRPIADNATAEGRARNRRIAVTILPDELAVADTVPAAPPANADNNAQPPPAPTETPEPLAK